VLPGYRAIRVMKQIDKQMKKTTKKARIGSVTSKKRGLADIGEMLRFFSASLVPAIESATGTFKVICQTRKTDRVKSIRILHLLNFEQLIITQLYITWDGLCSGLPCVDEL
jgi:hypothetical protein